MALVYADRVKVRARTTGTGDFTLESTVNGFQSFSAIGDGNETFYGIVDPYGNWEIGQGRYEIDSTEERLIRLTVISSSNSNNLVDFPAGGKNVFTTLPSSVAGDAARITAAGNITDLFINADGRLELPVDANSDSRLQGDSSEIKLISNDINGISLSYVNADPNSSWSTLTNGSTTRNTVSIDSDSFDVNFDANNSGPAFSVSSAGTVTISNGTGSATLKVGDSDQLALGDSSGSTSQSQGAVAIGGLAGQTNQGSRAIAIGYVTGNSSQGTGAIAIGGDAAQSGQGDQAIAIGYLAGGFDQGTNSIAIGYQAGNSGTAAGSILIDATASGMGTTNPGFYVNPIRSGEPDQILYFNTATKEITHGDPFSFRIAADDSTQTEISNRNTIQFDGAGLTSTSSDANGTITITTRADYVVYKHVNDQSTAGLARVTFSSTAARSSGTSFGSMAATGVFTFSRAGIYQVIVNFNVSGNPQAFGGINGTSGERYNQATVPGVGGWQNSTVDVISVSASDTYEWWVGTGVVIYGNDPNTTTRIQFIRIG
jgi:hypothetical protein